MRQIEGISQSAPEIVMDYTVQKNGPQFYINRRHVDFKRQLYKYYIFDQDTDTFYDFQTYPNLALGGLQDDSQGSAAV